MSHAEDAQITKMYFDTCGKYTHNEQKRDISHVVKRAYLGYFDINHGDQDKTWVLHILYKTCTEHLR